MRLVNHASDLVHQIYQHEKVEDVVKWRDAACCFGSGAQVQRRLKFGGGRMGGEPKPHSLSFGPHLLGESRVSTGKVDI